MRHKRADARGEKIMRKVIAGILMGAAVLSLAACGKSETAQTTAAQAAESKDTQAVPLKDGPPRSGAAVRNDRRPRRS